MVSVKQTNLSAAGRPLERKLADFDRHADAAVGFLLAFIEEYREPLIHQARGRQVRGHFEFEDKFLYEYSKSRLLAETSEEVADAIVYISRMLAVRGTL